MRFELISCYLLLSCVCTTLGSINIGTTGNLGNVNSDNVQSVKPSNSASTKGLTNDPVQPLNDFNSNTVNSGEGGNVNSDDNSNVQTVKPSNSASVNALTDIPVQPTNDLNSNSNVQGLKYHLTLTVGFEPITHKQLPFLYKGQFQIPFRENYFYGLIVIDFKDVTGENKIKLLADKRTLYILSYNTTVVEKQRVGDYVLSPNILKIEKQTFIGKNIYEITMRENLVKNRMYAVHLCFFGEMELQNNHVYASMSVSDDPNIPDIKQFLTNFGVSHSMYRLFPSGDPNIPAEFLLKIFRRNEYVSIANTLLERSTKLEDSEYFQDEFLPIYNVVPTELVFTVVSKFTELKNILNNRSRKMGNLYHEVLDENSGDRHIITFRQIAPGKHNVIGSETQQVTGNEPKMILLEGHPEIPKKRRVLSNMLKRNR